MERAISYSDRTIEYTFQDDGLSIGEEVFIISTTNPIIQRMKANKPSSSPAQEHEEVESKTEMSFLDHLEDLRGTLIRCSLSFIVACVLVMTFMKYFADMLNWPLQFALGDDVELVEHPPIYSGVATTAPNPSMTSPTPSGGQKRQFGLITTSPMAVFSVILQVTFLGGFALSLPLMLYFISRFIVPGLNPQELSIIKPACMAAFLLFAVGVSFSYFALVPASLKASIFFNELFGYQVLWSADRYYALLVWMTMGIGISFQFPLVLVILVYVGILDTVKLKAFRPYSIVVFLIVAAVVTPTTDPITFLLLAVPMSILYELAMRVSRRVERKLGREVAV